MHHELGHTTTTASPLFIDNQSAIKVTQNPEHHGRMKDLDLRTFWLRDTVAAGLITPFHLTTSDMVADLLTKPLARDKVEKFRKMMGLVWFHSHVLHQVKGGVFELPLVQQSYIYQHLLFLVYCLSSLFSILVLSSLFSSCCSISLVLHPCSLSIVLSLLSCPLSYLPCSLSHLYKTGMQWAISPASYIAFQVSSIHSQWHNFLHCIPEWSISYYGAEGLVTTFLYNSI